MAKKVVKKAKKKSSAKSKKTSSSKRDIVTLILRDHKPLWKLLKTLKSERATVKDKRSAFEEFEPMLKAHAEPEGETWYKEMKNEDEFKQEGLEGDIEHGLADQLCKELQNTKDDDEFEAKAKVLAEIVEHHLEEEEEEMLPEFKKKSPLETREALGDQYEELRSKY